MAIQFNNKPALLVFDKLIQYDGYLTKNIGFADRDAAIKWWEQNEQELLTLGVTGATLDILAMPI